MKSHQKFKRSDCGIVSRLFAVKSNLEDLTESIRWGFSPQ